MALTYISLSKRGISWGNVKSAILKFFNKFLHAKKTQYNRICSHTKSPKSFVTKRFSSNFMLHHYL